MRNYKAQLFVAAFATIIALPMPVLAHSGGTDSSGCHTNRKTGDYHCHGGGTQRAPTPAHFSGVGKEPTRIAPPLAQLEQPRLSR